MNRSVVDLIGVFERLLGQHRSMVRERKSCGTELARLTSLLGGFSAANQRVAEQSKHQLADLCVLLTRFKEELQKWAKSQESEAETFNLFEVLGVAADEVRHSTVLAWLLDHRIERAGTHAQGNLGFHLFLKEMGLPPEYAETQYWVRRERAGDESRVDVEVAARGRFVIHIENKIHSAEGPDQTDREWADLLRRAEQIGIDPASKPSRVHAFFITLGGDKAENENFRPVRWSEIARVLDRFSVQAQPPDVKLFAAHFARALRALRADRFQEERSTDNGERRI